MRTGRGRRNAASNPARFCPEIPLFPRCLGVVVPLAERLQIPLVHKQRPVSPVRDDVVHDRGAGAKALRRTDAAERFPQELRRAIL